MNELRIVDPEDCKNKYEQPENKASSRRKTFDKSPIIELDKHLRRENKNRNGNTCVTYEKYLIKFFRYCKYNEIDQEHPKVDDIYDFFDLHPKWSCGTKRSALSAFRKYYNKCRNLGLIINMDLPYEEKPLFYISSEELEAFFNSIENPYDRLILLFKYSSGIRSTELINMRWADINIDTARGMLYNTKNRTDRVILFLYNGKDLLQQLKEYRGSAKDGDFIFPNMYNDKLLWHMCHKYAVKFGNPKITPHNLRHAFATHLAEVGKTGFQITALLGQKHVKSAEKYINLVKSNKLPELVDENPLNKHKILVIKEGLTEKVINQL